VLFIEGGGLKGKGSSTSHRSAVGGASKRAGSVSKFNKSGGRKTMKRPSAASSVGSTAVATGTLATPAPSASSLPSAVTSD